MQNQLCNTLQQGTILQGKSYKYIIKEILGQGTFGITYLADVKMQGALGSLDSSMKVAIKEFFMREINGREGTTVTSGSQGGLYADYRKKFAREAQNLAKLQHPHIIKVLESFEENNTIYYVMEYVDGGSLDDYIEKKEQIPEQEAMELTKQICSALSFMHKNKMLHLDLKPGNIMRKKNGTLVLIDFGLSKNYNSNGEPESSTTVGGGTPGYAPLEQSTHHDGHGFPVTMDVYALGATMYKMLTGVRAPEASEILNDGFPSYNLQNSGVSNNIIGVVEKAMMPLKKNRYQNIAELLMAISQNKTSEETFVETPLIIDGGITTVKVHYYDGPIPDALSYDFIANKNKATFTIQNSYGNKVSAEIKNFTWNNFILFFNAQGLRINDQSSNSMEGGSITDIEIFNSSGICLKARQQTGGIRNTGTLVGNIRPLHKYIKSYDSVSFAFDSIKNVNNDEERNLGTEINNFETRYSKEDFERLFCAIFLTIGCIWAETWSSNSFESIWLYVFLKFVCCPVFIILTPWILYRDWKKIFYITEYHVCEYGFRLIKRKKICRQSSYDITDIHFQSCQMSVNREYHKDVDGYSYSDHYFYNNQGIPIVFINNTLASDCIYKQYVKVTGHEPNAKIKHSENKQVITKFLNNIKKSHIVIITGVVMCVLLILHFTIPTAPAVQENIKKHTEKVDSTKVFPQKSIAKKNYFDANDINAYDGVTSGYKWIDLGLPSGTKWATCNIGANSPTKVGDYFAWGETKTRSSYTENNDWYFNVKGLTPSHDVAKKTMGNAWRIPSQKDFEELIKNCKYVNVDSGAVFIGQNGHKIFLPFSGTKYDKNVTRENGESMSASDYWSSTAWVTDDGLFKDSGAKTLSLWKDHAEVNQLATFHGLNVRAVAK